MRVPSLLPEYPPEYQAAIDKLYGKRRMAPGEVNPFLYENFDKPLWVVYGPDCFPSIFCCIVIIMPTYTRQQPVIWGYSIYRGDPGFRTLGQQLDDWMKNERTHRAHFFSSQPEAIAYLNKLVTIKPGTT